jgi:hypothetical protein
MRFEIIMAAIKTTIMKMLHKKISNYHKIQCNLSFILFQLSFKCNVFFNYYFLISPSLLMTKLKISILILCFLHFTNIYNKYVWFTLLDRQDLG